MSDEVVCGMEESEDAHTMKVVLELPLVIQDSYLAQQRKRNKTFEDYLTNIILDHETRTHYRRKRKR